MGGEKTVSWRAHASTSTAAQSATCQAAKAPHDVLQLAGVALGSSAGPAEGIVFWGRNEL